jgi:hypothetical protein
MCLYPIVKFACCDTQFRPDGGLPIVKFCARGHGDTIREAFPGCAARQPHECHDLFRLPVKCPDHKLQWLTRMDLNAECQAMDAQLRAAGVSEHLRSRYRDKMGRAFEMVVKCAQLMEAERLQAWKVKVFCTGAALELLGTAIVGSDAKPLDYSVLERLRERLVRHINAEAQQLKEDAIRRGGGGGRSPEQVELGPEGEWIQPRTWSSSALSPPQSPSPAAEGGRGGPAMDGVPPIDTAITTTTTTTTTTIPGPDSPLLDDMQHLLSREFLPGRPSPRFPTTTAFSPSSHLSFHQEHPGPTFPFPVIPLSANNRFPPPPLMPSQHHVGPAFRLGGGVSNDNNVPHFISPYSVAPERQFQVKQGLLLPTHMQMQMQQSAVSDGQFNPALGFFADDNMYGGGFSGISSHTLASFGSTAEEDDPEKTSDELARASAGEGEAFAGGEQ